MNLIDISSHQAGINLENLFSQNPSLDGVIVKVSDNMYYVNPYAREWLDYLISHNKLAGTYHYLNLLGAEVEAQHYVQAVEPWLGKVVLAIDYEAQTRYKGTKYLKACLDEVYRLTGIKPLVYCSCSLIQEQDFTAIANDGYQLWVAQYADFNPVSGFLETPWQRGSVEPFKRYVMHQYTSCGYLTGWDDNLDFDLFYGTAEDWAQLTKPYIETVELKGPDPVVVSEVLMGTYGINQEREYNLLKAGYNPQLVQQKINEIYEIASKIRPVVESNIDYINSIMKVVKLV